MNYFKIGERIRKIRKERAYSQEKLAELINISVTHMSHIETGNTKLSLPVFAELATMLNVSADYLIFGYDDKTNSEKLLSIISNCSDKEIEIITNIAQTIKDKGL